MTAYIKMDISVITIKNKSQFHPCAEKGVIYYLFIVT
jgi:hypothetical protein